MPRQIDCASFCSPLTLVYPCASSRLRASASVKLLAPATGAAAVLDSALLVDAAGGIVEGARAAGPVIGFGGAVAGADGAVARDGGPGAFVCATAIAAPMMPRVSARGSILVMSG